MKSALIFILLATAGITATASPADAEGHPDREVTRGHVMTLQGGEDLGYELRGRARMVRTDRWGGMTRVVIRVRGLDPNTSYPAHVHNQPCSATPAGGGHYQHVIGGSVDPVNEIWPTITTDDRGSGLGFAIHGERAREDARSIVVHYPPNTSIRLACVDLS
jgi:hypothetical protein